MPDRTINSRAFRTEFIRLTEPTAVTALGRVIGVWHPVSVAVYGTEIDGRPGVRVVVASPTPRSSPETPAAGRVPGAELVAGEVRTQETTGAPDTGSPVSAVEAGGGGIHATGGHLDPAPQRRKSSQAARDRILRGVNRGER